MSRTTVVSRKMVTPDTEFASAYDLKGLGGPLPDNSLPKWEVVPLHQKIPMGHFYKPVNSKMPQLAPVHLHKLGVSKLHIKDESRTGEFDTSKAPSKLLEYRAENDPHLHAFFKRPIIRQRLIDQGIVDKNGNVPCTLKEFNLWRKYVYDKQVLNASRRENVKNNLIKPAPAGAIVKGMHVRQRDYQMQDMVNQLGYLRNEIKQCEKNLESALQEYQKIMLKDNEFLDKRSELEEEISRRKQILARKQKTFREGLLWLENIESEYEKRNIADEHTGRQFEKMRKLFLQKKLQDAYMEEEKFKRAVKNFEKTRRENTRYEMDQQKYKQYTDFVYKKLKDLRAQRRKEEEKCILKLMNRMLSYRLNGSVQSVSTQVDGMSTASIMTITTADSINSVDVAELNDFMADVFTINAYRALPRMDTDELKEGKKKVYNYYLAKSASSDGTVDGIQNLRKYWKRFIHSSDPCIKATSIRGIVKKLAKNALVQNFECPWQDLVKLKSAYRAPGVFFDKRGRVVLDKDFYAQICAMETNEYKDSENSEKKRSWWKNGSIDYSKQEIEDKDGTYTNMLKNKVDVLTGKTQASNSSAASAKEKSEGLKKDSPSKGTVVSQKSKKNSKSAIKSGK